MTQDDFRKRLHDLSVESTRDLPMVQVFEMLTSHQHAFQIAYEVFLVDEMRQRGAEDPKQESPP
jgi:hypothetical protein